MSVRMMSLVWELDLPDSEKLVALALADCANDEGYCWPSIETLTKKCSKSERTVQNSIRTLCAKGHLTQRPGAHKSWDYIVHPIVRFASDTPAEIAPRKVCTPQPLHPDPATAAPEPRNGCTQTIKNHKEPSSARTRAAGVKHFIPQDWKAPPRSELPPQSRACAEQWTDASYLTEAEGFLLYWRGERKMKSDWRGTWANRIIARHSAVMRDQKFGNGAPEARRPLSNAEQIAQLERFLPRWERDNPEEATRARAKIAELQGDPGRRIVSIGQAVQNIRAA